MPYLKKVIPQPEPIDCRILTAALDLFVQHGYHNISIHEIQKQAQVSIGSIYNYFGGKEGIARALYQHILNELDQAVDDVIAEGGSPSEQCKRVMADLFNYTETHRNIIAFAFHPKHAEFLPEEPRPSDSSAFTKMRGIVQRGMDLGEFRQMDTWVAASGMFGGAIRMIQLRLEGKIERPLPEYLEAVLLTARVGLCTQSAAQLVTPVPVQDLQAASIEAAA
ncbi:TetR/AcrR family transcriptional regulator [uncultured Thiothrix sp.]|uniref:TetR/AcrR family transcriptional regulator n=1 Tax=uncultured Thiothrix sp. TaxID=223185 RepID=UPI002621E44D|nr:TetR/AcrR family transcriptional regulator [uncultured Thiothrix sp.]